MNERGIAVLIAKILSNKYRNSFSVRLGAQLILAKYGVIGPWAKFIGYGLRLGIGFLMEVGVYQIDLLLDSYREGMKYEAFMKEAKAAYEKATAKIYTEAEKQKIRQEYLAIISRIGVVGN